MSLEAFSASTSRALAYQERVLHKLLETAQGEDRLTASLALDRLRNEYRARNTRKIDRMRARFGLIRHAECPPDIDKKNRHPKKGKLPEIRLSEAA